MKKTFRKLTAVLLVAVMAVTCLPQEAIAEILPQETEVLTSGDTGIYNDFEYEELADGTLSITGYRGSDTEIVIPAEIEGKKVTEIGEMAFSYDSLTKTTIPNSVTTIEWGAFYQCDITEIIIPSSVTSIGDYAFYQCYSLVEITIPDSVTSIGNYAFAYCTSLTEITIPNSITSLANGVLSCCFSLTNVIIPNSITSIGFRAFYDCIALFKIIIPNSVMSIDDEAFAFCSSLTDIIIPDSVISMGTYVFWECYDVTIYCNAGSRAETYAKEHGIHFAIIDDYKGNEIYFKDKFTVLSPGESQKLTVNSCDVTIKNGEIVRSNILPVNNSSLKWTLTSGEGVISLSEDGTVTALSEGLASLDVYSKDDMSLFTSCFVYVGNPNTFEFSGTYDTRQYYSNGGFYSQTSSLSDCVEIYLLFNNKFADELARIDYDPEKDSTNKELKSVAPITLTASVSGNGLSFDRDSNKNTYTASFEEIQAGEAAHDLLMLFPTENLASNSLRTEYTVTVTLKSDSFDTVTEKYSFTIEPLETKNAKEHIAFTVNPDYLLSKKNLYGNTMVDLKDDEEYGWTKVTTFNFDNYYQIVLSDILIEMLNVNQKQAPSLVPSVVKEWYGTYKTLLGDITTLVNDSYLDNIDLSETAVDKLLKESKYVTNGIHTDDDVYQAVLDLLGTIDNVDKITKIFEKIDKTNQVFKMVKLGTNVIGDIMDWGNKLAVFNAFAESEQSLKTVMKHLADTIPASDYKMKEAVYDYINYSNDLGGQLEEVVESFYEMSGKVAIEEFNSFVGMSMIKYIGIHLFNWVCNHVTLNGGISVAASAAFPIVQTYFSAALVGVDLGLCLSDVLCNTSDISVEMSKTVAMSEFSPYIISTLNYYEAALYDAPNDDSVMVFEDAFFLHRAAQSYIMEHTVKSLETKRDSVLIGLIGNLIGQGRGDYNEVISAVLAHKSVIDNLKCHSYTGETTAVTQTKVITVRCPVNVFVYGQDGTETVIITDDEVEYAAEGINVFVQNGEKYIALPADQTYSIKIVAFGDGVMEYRVDEYGDGGQCLKTVEKSEIPLVDGRMFTGQIVDQMNAEPESYALVYDGVPVVPDELSALPGDVDGSGEVDELDSVALARYLASWDVAIDQSAADVDGNGEVDELDSVMLARKLAGWNV